MEKHLIVLAHSKVASAYFCSLVFQYFPSSPIYSIPWPYLATINCLNEPLSSGNLHTWATLLLGVIFLTTCISKTEPNTVMSFNVQCSHALELFLRIILWAKFPSLVHRQLSVLASVTIQLWRLWQYIYFFFLTHCSILGINNTPYMTVPNAYIGDNVFLKD